MHMHRVKSMPYLFTAAEDQRTGGAGLFTSLARCLSRADLSSSNSAESNAKNSNGTVLCPPDHGACFFERISRSRRAMRRTCDEIDTSGLSLSQEFKL
jgi:hypothetical protein